MTNRVTSSEDERELFSYLYFRDNAAGHQRERNTDRNQVLQVARPGALQ